MKFRKLGILLLFTILLTGLTVFEVSVADELNRDAIIFTTELQAGDYVTFGHYPQTAMGDDNTPIEWLVLENEGETALLISRYALEGEPYNDALEGVTWETCTLRSWLNNRFYNKAFTSDEKGYIVQSQVAPGTNPYFHIDAGNETWDHVFILSIEEASGYSDSMRMCAPTAYAAAKGVYTNRDNRINGRAACHWWLRSLGDLPHSVTGVDSDGSVDVYGCDANDTDCGVRPCVRVRLSEDSQKKASQAKKWDEANYQVGEHVLFGSYPQSEAGMDDTPIEWLVLENDGESVLLISRYGLDSKPYNTENSWYSTWELSTLRTWLNDEFYKRAFNADEQKSIILTHNSERRNPDYYTENGKPTRDNVFLLSRSELYQYFPDESTRGCEHTDYAKVQAEGRSYNGPNYAWWLRSPGKRSQDSAAYVSMDGTSIMAERAYKECIVRPCIRVQLPGTERKSREEGITRENCAVGDCVTFGSYPQTEKGNDYTPIEWLVLENDGETALLVSRYALDCQPYNAEGTDEAWETCTLRNWLNSEFYSIAFSAEENRYICKSENQTSALSGYGNAVSVTNDFVFLLSREEVNTYFADDYARKCAPTDYARQQGVETSSYEKIDARATCWWWLRTPGYVGVRDFGYVDNGGIYTSGQNHAVRPCIRVRFSDASDNAGDEKSGFDFTGQIVDSNSRGDEQDYQVGSYVTFGNYAQTAAGNDSTPVEWLVLENDGETALLISRYALTSVPFARELSENTWRECTLRKWLNDTFYSRAFNAKEQANILTSSVSADENPQYSTYPGRASEDNVFLLSIAEVEKYLAGSDDMKCVPTDHAIEQGAYRSRRCKVDGKDTCWWWLRTPGERVYYTALVDDAGLVYNVGDDANNSVIAVRPCIRVRVTSGSRNTRNGDERGTQSENGQSEQAYGGQKTQAEDDRGTQSESDRSEQSYGGQKTQTGENRGTQSSDSRNVQTSGVDTQAFRVGESITLGHYPQTADGNDDTPIEWVILAKEDNKALLLSRYALDVLQYDAYSSQYVYWEACTMRAWLNGEFANRAFSAREYEAILDTDVPNGIEQSLDRDEYGGNDTVDRVFVLSVNEMLNYHTITWDERYRATAYAMEQARKALREKCNREKTTFYVAESRMGAVEEWLRSPRSAIRVDTYFAGGIHYSDTNDFRYVRPAIWVDLREEVFR
ncbi:MAG: DUF6273 domain-containing protein [Clostridia bacterium]|nr:DUF6273 domain-containing protein [Clostridia bacterium]